MTQQHMSMRTQREQRIQIQVCQWLKLMYPKIIFTCDLSSGMKMTMGQAVQSAKMRSSRGLPDLMIFERRGGFNGLFIELKVAGTRIKLKDGTLTTDKHIREQYTILCLLMNKGYRAAFGVGFDHTIAIINEYLALSPK